MCSLSFDSALATGSDSALTTDLPDDSTQQSPRQVQTPRFAVVNLGCKVNRVEADTIAAACMQCGAKRSKLSDADLVVINTCTVTAEADSKTRKAIRHARKNASCPIVVTGCAAAMDPVGLAGLAEGVEVIPSHVQAQARAISILSEGKQNPELLSSVSADAVALRSTVEFKTRVDIKIQDGCDNECTYCIVCRARGKARSLDHQKALAQIEEAANSGVGEIILAGINVGCYNDGEMSLAKLVRTALETTDIGRIRLSSIEPQSVDTDLLELLQDHPARLCAHFHMPLQSGCDRTLRAMGRKCLTQDFAQRVAWLREIRPDVAISTDLIVGFPGETDEDFEETYAFCKAMRFSRMHVFRFSKRPGTPAADMPNQIDPKISAQRSAKMRDLAKSMEQADALSRLGTWEQVLMLSPHEGMSESYHEVWVEQELSTGKLISLQLSELLSNGRLLAQRAG